MSMPEQPAPADGLLTVVAGQVATVLSEQGKQSVQLARIEEQVRAVPAIADRVRQLELEQAKDTGARDVWARLIAGLAVLAAGLATAADYFHH